MTPTELAMYTGRALVADLERRGVDRISDPAVAYHVGLHLKHVLLDGTSLDDATERACYRSANMASRGERARIVVWLRAQAQDEGVNENARRTLADAARCIEEGEHGPMDGEP